MAFVLMSSSAFAYTFSGRVIDAETKEPIEGAVVVARWQKEKAVFVETVQKLKDVKETLTNENGEWSIEGPKGHEYGKINPLLVIVSHIPFVYYTLKPEFIIFKPGYCSWPKGRRIAACSGIDYHSDEGYWHGATIELPRLTERDRKTIMRNMPSTGGMSKKEHKIQKFKKLIAQEEMEIRR
jgi:hypothetical protein